MAARKDESKFCSTCRYFIGTVYDSKGRPKEGLCDDGFSHKVYGPTYWGCKYHRIDPVVNNTVRTK